MYVPCTESRYEIYMKNKQKQKQCYFFTKIKLQCKNKKGPKLYFDKL